MKRAIINLHGALLEKLLKLPEGVHVYSVHGNWHMDSIEVMVTGDALPNEAEHISGTYPIQIPLTIEVTEDGRYEVKW